MVTASDWTIRLKVSGIQTDIKAILIREIEAYTGKGKRVVNTSLIVQFIDEKIIIEQDTNSKMLVDALEQAGESVPESV